MAIVLLWKATGTTPSTTSGVVPSPKLPALYVVGTIFLDFFAARNFRLLNCVRSKILFAAFCTRNLPTLRTETIVFLDGSDATCSIIMALYPAPLLKCATVSDAANVTLFLPQNLVFGHFVHNTAFIDSF